MVSDVCHLLPHTSNLKSTTMHDARCQPISTMIFGTILLSLHHHRTNNHVPFWTNRTRFLFYNAWRSTRVWFLLAYGGKPMRDYQSERAIELLFFFQHMWQWALSDQVHSYWVCCLQLWCYLLLLWTRCMLYRKLYFLANEISPPFVQRRHAIWNRERDVRRLHFCLRPPTVLLLQLQRSKL